MALQIQRGPTRAAIRIFLHGQEGVGKTTWAAGCPDTVFVTIEDGGGDLDYARAVVPTWPALRQAVRDLLRDPQGFRALAIDTIDTYESALWRWICETARVDSIEEVAGGYGKGYIRAAEEMRGLSEDLDGLRHRHGLHILVVGHSHVKPFNDPMGPPFDRYEPRLHKTTAALWLGWADVVLFAAFDVTVKTGSRRADPDPTKKGKAVSAKRTLYTTKDAAYDAKNRYSLPEELPLDWAAFARAMRWEERASAIRSPAAKADTDSAQRAHHESWAAHYRSFCAQLSDLGIAGPTKLYEDAVGPWCEAEGWGRPSTWTTEDREKLVEDLRDPTGAARRKLTGFIATTQES